MRSASAVSRTRFASLDTVQRILRPLPGVDARLSPDGAEHRPILLRRLKPMWMAEPSVTREHLQSIEAQTLIIVGDSDIATAERAGPDVMPKETILTFLEEGAAGGK